MYPCQYCFLHMAQQLLRLYLSCRTKIQILHWRQNKMKKRILWYRNQIDDWLKQGGEREWNAVLEEHLQQIAFFQHERLIHLIVTVLFAALEFLAIGFFVVTDNLGFGMLAFSLLILLVPYIRHYYLLENEVQKMYGQYDKLLELCGKKG